MHGMVGSGRAQNRIVARCGGHWLRDGLRCRFAKTAEVDVDFCEVPVLRLRESGG